MSRPPEGVAPPLPGLTRGAIAALVAGNALEFYDFIVYAYFAVYIGRAFFPVGGEYGSLLASVATFGVGFFTRPLGAVLIGAMADRHGRKPAMLLSMSLITAGTLGIALTPGYESIGLAAPLIVVVCRLLQGLALGGEVGSATALLIEAAPASRRGLYASWQVASQGLAVLAGGLVGLVLSLALTPEQLASWGWRLPFALGLLLIPTVLRIRRSLPETFRRPPAERGAPVVRAVLREHRRVLALGILISLSTAVISQIGNFMATYAMQMLALPPAAAQAGVLVGGAMTLPGALLGGWLSDRYGRRAVNLFPRLLLMAATLPLFMWLTREPGAAALMAVTALLGLFMAVFYAASMVTIVELMPMAVRSTGLSLVYAVSSSLFGGTAPFVITWWIAQTHDPLVPAYYATAATALGAWALLYLPESRGTDVHR